MAGTFKPPVVETVRAELMSFAALLESEVAGCIITVSWARCPWQRKTESGPNSQQNTKYNQTLPNDPWPGEVRTSFVCESAVEVSDPDQAEQVRDDKTICGHRQSESSESMVIGSYWSRYYLGFPEPERNSRGMSLCRFCEAESSGEALSPLIAVTNASVAPRSSEAWLRLCGAMNRFFSQDRYRAGFIISVYPPDDRTDLRASYCLWQYE